MGAWVRHRHFLTSFGCQNVFSPVWQAGGDSLCFFSSVRCPADQAQITWDMRFDRPLQPHDLQFCQSTGVERTTMIFAALGTLLPLPLLLPFPLLPATHTHTLVDPLSLLLSLSPSLRPHRWTSLLPWTATNFGVHGQKEGGGQKERQKAPLFRAFGSFSHLKFTFSSLWEVLVGEPPALQSPPIPRGNCQRREGVECSAGEEQKARNVWPLLPPLLPPTLQDPQLSCFGAHPSGHSGPGLPFFFQRPDLVRSRTRNQAAQSHSQGPLPRTFERGKGQISTHVPCGGHVCTRQLIRGSRETDIVDRENIFKFWLVAHNETGRLRSTGSNFLMTSNRCSSFTNSGLCR